MKYFMHEDIANRSNMNFLLMFFEEQEPKPHYLCTNLRRGIFYIF